MQELFLYSESSVGWGAIGSGDLASCNEWHSLDTSHGHTDPNGGYHYHGVIKIILYKSCSELFLLEQFETCTFRAEQSFQLKNNQSL